MEELDAGKDVLNGTVADSRGFQTSKGHQSVPVSGADWSIKFCAKDDKLLYIASMVTLSTFGIHSRLS